MCCPGVSIFNQEGNRPELKDRLMGFDTQKCPDAIHWWTDNMGMKRQTTEDTKETIMNQKCCVLRGLR